MGGNGSGRRVGWKTEMGGKRSGRKARSSGSKPRQLPTAMPGLGEPAGWWVKWEGISAVVATLVGIGGAFFYLYDRFVEPPPPPAPAPSADVIGYAGDGALRAAARRRRARQMPMITPTMARAATPPAAHPMMSPRLLLVVLFDVDEPDVEEPDAEPDADARRTLDTTNLCARLWPSSTPVATISSPAAILPSIALVCMKPTMRECFFCN